MTKLENGVDNKMYRKLENGIGRGPADAEEDYERRGDTRHYKANNIGGREGKKLSQKKSMNYNNSNRGYSGRG